MTVWGNRKGGFMKSIILAVGLAMLFSVGLFFIADAALAECRMICIDGRCLTCCTNGDATQCF